MKRFFIGLFGATLATMAQADPVLGTWKTEPDDGIYAHIEMVSCGPAICGNIVATYENGNPFVSPNQGRALVIDMIPQGDGSYQGKVWRPSNDKIYLGKMTLDGNQLALRGCVAGGLLCSKQTWARVK